MAPQMSLEELWSQASDSELTAAASNPGLRDDARRVIQSELDRRGITIAPTIDRIDAQPLRQVQPPPVVDGIQSVRMTVRGSNGRIDVSDGELRIHNSKDTTMRVEDICGVTMERAGMFGGLLHIATFRNPAPPTGKFTGASHPQVLLFNPKHQGDVDRLVGLIQAYLAANPAADRHPAGAAVASQVMKLDVLPVNTRKIYDEQIHDTNVRFVIMGVKGQALIALKERLVIVKAGFMAGATGGGRATSFRYGDITGIEINTGWVNAVIEVLTASYTGTQQHDFWAAGRDRDPWKLSNCLPLTKDLLEQQRPFIGELQTLVDSARRAATTPVAETRDVATQLKELAELHRTGVLSAQEFAKAKAKLLGL